MSGRRTRTPIGGFTRLTPELHAGICNLLAIGAPINVAAKALGASPSSVDRWRARGEADHLAGTVSVFARFFVDSEAAMSRGHLHAQLDVVQTRRQDPRTALEYLARRWPETWGKQVAEVRHSGRVGVGVEVDLSQHLDLSTFTDEQLAGLEAHLMVREEIDRRQARQIVDAELAEPPPLRRRAPPTEEGG